MNIGILGGSFDPIHNGHLHMAVCAHQAFPLDQVWLMPAGHSPNKDETVMTPATERFRMCEIAAQSYDWLYVSSLEINSKERSYTFRTMQKLTADYPMHRFFFLMGGDSLDYFEKWSHPDIIARLSTILVIPRDQFDTSQLKEKIQVLQRHFDCDIRIVPCAEYPISSTEIRKRLYEGQSHEEDFPPGVLAYIRKNQMYCR